VKYKCEMCNGKISKEDYEFCDICPDCLEGNDGEQYEKLIY